MSSIFTKIVTGEIPCFKIAEDDDFFAFMDIRPIHRGHVLVVPKIEVDYIFDLPDELLQRMLLFARPIARAQREIIDCERVGLMVAGLEVPHAHLHLIPFNDGRQLSFEHAAQADMDELKEIADLLVEKLNA